MRDTLSLQPVKSLFSKLDKLPRPARFRILLRTAGHKFMRPVEPQPHTMRYRLRQEAVIASGRAGLHQLGNVFSLQRRGPVPTIVIGGFVPDSTESVYLLKDLLLRHGSVYCLNYPRLGFDIELIFAQLDDLVEEVTVTHGREPVILAVSFGAGLVLEWLRRRRMLGGQPDVRGLVLVSPVACVEDLLPAALPKPRTLLGRAIKPYLTATDGKVDEKTVEKSRMVFEKMFEAGAQNKAAIDLVMTLDEVRRLREQVMATIAGISFKGACERVGALGAFQAPQEYFKPGVLPLSDAPCMILYAEKEESVLDENAPSRHAFETAHRAYFPRSQCKLVRNPGGSPVQHASLIFHQANFRAHLNSFYRVLRGGWARNAA